MFETQAMRNDFDSPWKEAISLYFQDFLEFFFPEIHADVDWSKGHEFLESELQAISREAEHGRRHADSLVRVQRRSGASQLVFIHLEVQSQEDHQFTARMLLYHTRILDRFGHGVCSLAIIGDRKAHWRPSSHRNSLWGCSLNLEFPMRKLLDYPDWASSTHNPFAWLTAAHLQAQATRRNLRKRAEIKFRLIRGLYHCGLSRRQVQELFRLLDWILALSNDLEYTFRQDLACFEKENKMVYITSIERILREEERQAERQENCQAVRLAILGLHQQRWGELEPGAQANLQALDDHARLLQLLTELMTAHSSEEWKRSL